MFPLDEYVRDGLLPSLLGKLDHKPRIVPDIDGLMRHLELLHEFLCSLAVGASVDHEENDWGLSMHTLFYTELHTHRGDVRLVQV